MLNIHTLSYAAGIIDGEGSIKIWVSKIDSKRRGQFNLRVNVTSTDKCLIDWFIKNFGGNSYIMNSPSRIKFSNRKIGYVWECSRPKILEFLEGIYPFLIIKKEHCKIAIEFRKTFERRERFLTQEMKDLRLAIYHQISHLNSRGI